jgi:ATP-dependent helicase/nuclease subunit B
MKSMLSTIRLMNPGARREHVSSFLRETSRGSRRKTWVVSDLRSKFEIQSLLLEKQGFYEDFDVLRASELWRLLLRRIAPEFQVIPKDLVRARVKDLLESMDLELGLNSDQAICDFMDQMSPILFHPSGSKMIHEWFATNEQSQSRWKSWYEIAEKFAILFVNEKKVAPHWIGSLLLRLLPEQLDRINEIWNRDLVFDLGPELSQVETDLISQLKPYLDVWVLRPHPSFAEKFKILLAPYEPLDTDKKVSLDPPVLSFERVKVFRFSGMLAEIKHAVATARSWLEQGVRETEILIAAPDIEVYWPVLSSFLQQEGIAFNKELTTRLQSLPVVAQWMAILKVKSGEVTPEGLELATYGQELGQFEKLSRYEDFQSLFRQLLDAEDLRRLDTIAKAFERTMDPQTRMNLDQFLGQALSFWSRTDLSETLEILLKEILSKVESGLQMRFSSWIFYLERVLAKKEIRLQEASAHGVTVTGLLAGDSIHAKRRLFLGLSESQLKSPSTPLILPKEILAFNRDYGFYLQYPETSQKAFELEWLSQAASEEDHFSFPMTHLNGSLETPSQFWMDLRVRIGGEASLHSLDLPEATRWDELQASDVFQPSLQEELGLMNPEKLTLKKKPRLSASSFERFRDCPFIFVAEKVFQLRNPPDVDLDLDRRVRGTLAHALLERLLTPPIAWEVDQTKLTSLIEELRQELELPLMDESIWRGVVRQHLELAQRFLRYEKDWQINYPKSQNRGREVSFEFQFEGFEFTGKIDRIDGGVGDSKDLVLLDYKMGATSVKTFNTWFKENTLQLAFYTWALEKGFMAEFGGHKVVAAFYYVLKNLDRSQGFKLKSGPEGLYDLERKKAQIDETQKLQMFEQLETELRSVFKKLDQGELGPQPRNFEICDECHWRRLCRAPHLN